MCAGVVKPGRCGNLRVPTSSVVRVSCKLKGVIAIFWEGLKTHIAISTIKLAILSDMLFTRLELLPHVGIKRISYAVQYI